MLTIKNATWTLFDSWADLVKDLGAACFSYAKQHLIVKLFVGVTGLQFSQYAQILITEKELQPCFFYLADSMAKICWGT